MASHQIDAERCSLFYSFLFTAGMSSLAEACCSTAKMDCGKAVMNYGKQMPHQLTHQTIKQASKQATIIYIILHNASKLSSKQVVSAFPQNLCRQVVQDAPQQTHSEGEKTKDRKRSASWHHASCFPQRRLILDSDVLRISSKSIKFAPKNA